MSTAPAYAAPQPAPTLRPLYLVRFGFAVVWAAAFATTASTLGAFAGVLLVLYPAFDAAAAVVDARSSGPGRTPALLVNVAVSTLAAVGLLVASTDQLSTVLRVWGTWAVVAGLVQLVVALGRRGAGGHWPMIISGGISVLAGASFILSAADATTMVNLAGYAVLGGIFFLVSALRLGRSRG